MNQRRRRMMGYREAIRWVVLNDDTEFLDTEERVCSVTVVFLCDVYDRTTEEVITDLLKERKKSS